MKRRALLQTVLAAAGASLLGGRSPLAGAQAAKPPAVPGTVVGTAGANVRACAKVDCAVRGVASLGQAVTVTGAKVDGFVPIDWNGVSGFVYDLYVATPDGTPELIQGTPGCNRVALIFNLGQGYEMQMDPLRWLKSQNIPATVFPMGWWSTQNPDKLKEIGALGFPIGSHGEGRTPLTDRPDAEIAADVKAAEDAIAAVLGEKPQPYFTPYAAAMDERVRSVVAKAGYLPVAFNVPADDWNFGVDADHVFMKVVPNVTDGDIVELHLDGPATLQSTAIALPWIVDRLGNKGFTFVTIPEMARPCAAS